MAARICKIARIAQYVAIALVINLTFLAVLNHISSQSVTQRLEAERHYTGDTK